LKPADQRDVRRHNLSLVLREVAERGPRSRATVALETGLNKTTVSSLVAELIELGLVRESGQERPGAVGRPARRVEVHPGGPFVLGLEVNVDYLAAEVTDLAGAPLHGAFVGNDNRADPRRVLSTLRRLVERALEEPFAAGRRPAATTVAVPGLVDDGGRLVIAPNLRWRDVEVTEPLVSALGPVTVDNEANLGAVAELFDGAGRGLRDFVYISGNVGIGAGIVIGGEVFRGAHGSGGEIGHLAVAPDGPPCACGSRGCLERLAGQDALLRLAGLDPPVRGPAALPEWPGAMLAAAAREGQERTLEGLSRVGRALGVAIAAVANVLDPEAVVLGGHFAPLVEWLREPIERELDRRLVAGDRSGCLVLAARLGGEATVLGAAALSRHRVLADPAALDHDVRYATAAA
jgi:predicted NBD/HSP70 family sugar kinase